MFPSEYKTGRKIEHTDTKRIYLRECSEFNFFYAHRYDECQQSRPKGPREEVPSMGLGEAPHWQTSQSSGESTGLWESDPEPGSRMLNLDT